MFRKCLVVTADDFGLCPSVNKASLTALLKGCVTSLSIMAPAPYFKQAVDFALKNNIRHVGVHLTLTSEFANLRYSPVTPKKGVPSLVDKNGYLRKTIYSFSKHAKPEEIKRELENQIERVIKYKLIPTHLDSHMFALHSRVSKRRDFLPIILYLCKKYKLAFRSPFEKEELFLKRNKIKFISNSFKGSYDIPNKRKKLEYDKWIKRLPLGISEFILHCGYDDDQLKKVTKKSSRRQFDFNYALLADTLNLLRARRIKLISWKDALIRL